MEKPTLTNNPRGENTLEVPVVNFPNQKQQSNNKEKIKSEVVVNSIGETINKDWITITGIATSQVRSKSTSDTPAYIFLRQKNNNKHSQLECVNTKCQNCETLVVFRIKQDKQWFKPQISKGDNLQLGGYFADTHKPRPSFTAYYYDKKKWIYL